MAKVYYTADEVADELRVSQRTLYRYIKDGRLKGKKAEGGRKWLFTRADIDELKTHKTDPQNRPTKDAHNELIESIDGIKRRLRLVCKMLKEEDREEIFTMCKDKGYHAYGTPEELKIILAGDMIRDIMDDMNHLQDK